jgi:hypothetical protein
MRCCESRTTSSVDSVTARRAGEMLESILLAPVLRPLVAGNGMLGDYELELLAQEIAHSDGAGFAAMIASRLERAR